MTAVLASESGGGQFCAMCQARIADIYFRAVAIETLAIVEDGVGGIRVCDGPQQEAVDKLCAGRQSLFLGYRKYVAKNVEFSQA